MRKTLPLCVLLSNDSSDGPLRYNLPPIVGTLRGRFDLAGEKKLRNKGRRIGRDTRMRLRACSAL